MEEAAIKENGSSSTNSRMIHSPGRGFHSNKQYTNNIPQAHLVSLPLWCTLFACADARPIHSQLRILLLQHSATVAFSYMARLAPVCGAAQGTLVYPGQSIMFEEALAAFARHGDHPAMQIGKTRAYCMYFTLICIFLFCVLQVLSKNGGQLKTRLTSCLLVR